MTIEMYVYMLSLGGMWTRKLNGSINQEWRENSQHTIRHN